MESKHLQINFTVNVFSVASTYMPLVFRCQAFSSVFVLENPGKRVRDLAAFHSAPGPTPVGNHPGALSQGRELIDGQLFEGLHKSVWPMHFDAHRGVVS